MEITQGFELSEVKPNGSGLAFYFIGTSLNGRSAGVCSSPFSHSYSAFTRDYAIQEYPESTEFLTTRYLGFIPSLQVT